MAKNVLKLKVLAIGDGYNDTQMIMAADCGIRISANGGQNTEYAKIGQKKSVTAEADFTITNFFQVQKLVFAHGYHSKEQISKLIYFYFYKNVVLVSCEVTFQFLCGFSRQRLFIGIFVSLYNLVLSTLQSMVAIMLEYRNHSNFLQMIEPETYSKGLVQANSGQQKKLLFDFNRWVRNAMWHGFTITMLTMIVLVEPFESDKIEETKALRNTGLMDQSTVIFITVLCVIFIKLELELASTHAITVLVMFSTIGVTYALITVMSMESVCKMLDPDLCGIDTRSVINVNAFLLTIGLCCIIIFFEILLKKLTVCCRLFCS